MFFTPAPSSTFCHCSSISWRTSAPRWGSISSRTWIASTRSLGSSSSPRWIHQHLENFNELAGHRLQGTRATNNFFFIFSPFCQRSWSWPKTPNGECDSLSLNTCRCLQVCYRFWPNGILCFPYCTWPFSPSRPTRSGVLRWETKRPLYDLADRPCLCHPWGGHQQSKEARGAGNIIKRYSYFMYVWCSPFVSANKYYLHLLVRHGMGPADHHSEGHRNVQRSELPAPHDLPLLH